MTATRTPAPPRFFIPFLRLDGTFVALLLLCLVALRPLLLHDGLPNGPDVLYHTYRTAEMARSWEQGVFLPRWAEGMYYGYGSPVFHYYASLSYYLGAALMLLLNLTALDALRWLIVLALFLGAAGMYSFMKQQAGPAAGRLAGLLAGLAYVYSPYLVYTEPYGRGAYPEMLAFALFPLVLLAFGRLRRTGRGRDLALAALLGGLLILSHNLMAVTLTALLAGWLLWQFPGDLWQARRAWHTAGNDPRGFWWAQRGRLKPLAALALALGLTAYFWLPVLLEAGEVQLTNLTAVAELDYTQGFLDLPTLLAAPPIMDNGAINGLLHVLSVGVPQWVLAATGGFGVLALL
nr:6-pyruvoyl-tetrahydropterin synthase-related protein [Anaerolineae bacterium]